MKKLIILTLLLTSIFYSCSKDGNADVVEETNSIFRIELTSTGDYQNYDSTVNVNAVDGPITINANETVQDVILFSLDSSPTNIFTNETPTQSITVRLSLGETKIGSNTTESSFISLRVTKNGEEIDSQEFTILPDNMRNIVALEYQ